MKRALKKVKETKFIVQPFNEFVEESSVKEKRITTFDKSFLNIEIMGIQAMKDVCFVINAVHTGKD